MKSTLKMLLPTTFPSARSPWPRRLACRLTAISGALVPSATTVRPTTRGEIPTSVARRAAPRTNSSAPATRRASPATSSRKTEVVIARQSFRRRTRTTEWRSPFSRISVARSRVGAMFSRRFTSLISRQMLLAVVRAASSDSSAKRWK